MLELFLKFVAAAPEARKAKEDPANEVEKHMLAGSMASMSRLFTNLTIFCLGFRPGLITLGLRYRTCEYVL